MAIEDVIYGKNRNFYGGIEPDNMKTFNVYNNTDNVEITCGLPTDTVIDGQTLCTVAGARIMRKLGEYPQTENDGELVADIKADTKLVLEKDDQDWRYTAFPYSSRGVFARSLKNRGIVTDANDYFFGYDVDLSDPNPETRVSYPSECDNKNYAKAFMDFDNDAFNYGGWPSVGGTYFLPTPVIIAFKSKYLSHTLDRIRYILSTYSDGTNLDRFINPETTNPYDTTFFDDDVYMRFPKIFYFRWIENDTYHFRCSNRKINDNYECWQNYNINDEEIPWFYISAFPMSGTNRDRSGHGLTHATGSYLSQLKSISQKGIPGLSCVCYSDLALLTDLYTMMIKSTDISVTRTICDKVINYSTIPTGSANNRGLFYGKKFGETNANSHYKLFGIESLFYNGPVVGLNRFGKNLYYKITPGLKDGSKVKGFFDFSYPDDFKGISDISFYVPETSPIFDYLNTENTGIKWPKDPYNGWINQYYTKLIVLNGLILPGNDKEGSSTTNYCGYCKIYDNGLNNTTFSSIFQLVSNLNPYTFNLDTAGGSSSYNTFLSYKPLLNYEYPSEETS